MIERTAPSRGDGRPGLRRAPPNHSTARMNQSDASMESYSGSPSSPEKWPGISPSRRWAAKVLRTRARRPTRPVREREAGRRDHRLPAPVRQPREARQDRSCAGGPPPRRLPRGCAISSKTGSAVDAKSCRRRRSASRRWSGSPATSSREKSGERLRVRAQRPLPLERAPEVFLAVVAARGLLGVPEVPVPGRVQARRREDAAQEEAGQVGQRLDPATSRRGPRSPCPSRSISLLEPMGSAEGQQRADAERRPRRSPGSTQRTIVMDRSRTRQSERSIGEARRTRDATSGRARGETATRFRSVARDGGVAIDLRRDARSSSRGGHELVAARDHHPAPARRRDGRDVPAVVAAGARPRRPCRTRILPARRSRAIRGRGRGPRSSAADHSSGLRALRAAAMDRRCSRQVGEPFRGDSLSTGVRETSRSSRPGERRAGFAARLHATRVIRSSRRRLD